MVPPEGSSSCDPPCLTPKSFCGKVRQAQIVTVTGQKRKVLMFQRAVKMAVNEDLCCPLQDGVCTCEQGFTEVFLHTGQLTQCAPTPILEIPTWEDKKGDVKTIRAIDTPSPTSVQPGLPGRTWYLQPFGPGQNTQHTKTHTRSTQSDRSQA